MNNVHTMLSALLSGGEDPPHANTMGHGDSPVHRQGDPGVRTGRGERAGDPGPREERHLPTIPTATQVLPGFIARMPRALWRAPSLGAWGCQRDCWAPRPCPHAGPGKRGDRRLQVEVAWDPMLTPLPTAFHGLKINTFCFLSSEAGVYSPQRAGTEGGGNLLHK